MRRGILCGALLALFFAYGGAFAAEEGGRSWPVVFQREDSICLGDTLGRELKSVAKGYDAEISPDGAFVAFTDSDEKGGRYIAVLDLATERVTRLASVPGDNSYGPRWSPDRETLVFNHWDDAQSDWRFAVVSKDGEGFRVLASNEKLGGIHSPFWSSDGASVYGHDLETLYRIAADTGEVLERKKLTDVLGNEAEPSSAIRFSVSPDGTQWLFDATVRNRTTWLQTGDGSFGALFLYCPGDGTVKRLTDDSVSAGHPSWLPERGEYLFDGVMEERGKKGITPGMQSSFIIQRSVEHDDQRVLFENGYQPSAAVR
ncbi:MAG: hypothetical protein GX256_09030 [Fretibacterium sp.]|nr:hypothetical protein [Fretibacterium sp.]